MFAMSRHDNLATCRRRFLDEPSELFLPILETVKEMKRLTWSKVCPDGTKIKANASRHSARSHGRCHFQKATHWFIGLVAMCAADF